MRDRMIKSWEYKIVNIMGFVIIIFLNTLTYIYGIDRIKRLGNILIQKYDKKHN
jgi:hypothetical protein